MKRKEVSIPLGTINTIRKQTGKSVKHVSIPLGTINTAAAANADKAVEDVSIPLGTINTSERVLGFINVICFNSTRYN